MRQCLVITFILSLNITVAYGELEDNLYHEATKNLLELKEEKLPLIQMVSPEEILISSHQIGHDYDSEGSKFYPRCKDTGNCRDNRLLLVYAEYNNDVKANVPRKSGKFLADIVVNNNIYFPYFNKRAIIGGESQTPITLPDTLDEDLKKESPGYVSGKTSSWLSGASSSIIFNEMNGVEKARNGVQINDYSYASGGMFLPTDKKCDTISEKIKLVLDIYQDRSNRREVRDMAKEAYTALVEDGSDWETDCIHRIEENGGFTGSTLVGGDSINYNASGSRDLITGTHSVEEILKQGGYNGMSIKSVTQPLQDDVVYMGQNSLELDFIANVKDEEALYTIAKITGSSGAVYGNGGAMGYFGTARGPQTVHHIYDPHVDRDYKGDSYIDAELEIVGGPVDFNDIEVFQGESFYSALLTKSESCYADFDGNGQVTMSEIIFSEMSAEIASKPTLLSADFLVDYNRGANRPYEWNKTLYTSSSISKLTSINLFGSVGNGTKKYSKNYLTTRAAGHYNVMYSFKEENDCEITREYGEYIELEEITLSDLR